MAWISRIALMAGGGRVAWFLPPDAPNDRVVQGMAAIAVVTLCVLATAPSKRR